MERDDNWTIAFFNPGKNPGRPDVFGCATLGAVDAQGAHSPDADGLYIWRRDVPGRVVCGSCAQCLAALNDISFSPPASSRCWPRAMAQRPFWKPCA